MPQGPLNPRELGKYYALAQIGLEMVAPIGVGLALDYYFSWMPWGTVVGAVVGFVGGMAHLIAILNRRDDTDSSKPRRDAQ